jgi:5-methylcytosine-specific restriction protein A
MGRLTTLQPRIKQGEGRAIAKAETTSWRTGLNSTQRGYNYKWQKARESYFAKHPLCVECEKEGEVVIATDLDHIIPHRGDKDVFWDRTNWQGLCHEHHSAKTQREGG